MRDTRHGEDFLEKQLYINWNQTNLVLVDGETVRLAQQFISGCENCCPEAEMNFDYILDEITGSDPTVTEYIMSEAATCPECSNRITEKTLVASRP
jgi:hypothetical protein